MWTVAGWRICKGAGGNANNALEYAAEGKDIGEAATSGDFVECELFEPKHFPRAVYAVALEKFLWAITHAPVKKFCEPRL